MSSEDNGPNREESGDGGQGGQPQGGQPQGGQPQGGQTPPGQGQQGGQPQGGQPRGGQPQGGQPQGGQPPAGQPQGGQPQGGQPPAGQPQGQPGAGYQQGGYQESVTDIFSKPTTLDQIKAAVVFYALVGVGVGLTGFMWVNQYVSDTGFGAGLGAFAMFAAPFLFGVLLAVPVGLRIVDALRDIETEQFVYATAGVSVAAGNLVYLLLYRILISLEVEGDIQFGKLLVSMITSSIGAAIVAVGAAYFLLTQMQR